MGVFGGALAFTFSLVVCFVAAALLVPVLPWLIPALMLAFAACAVGILLSLLFAPLMGALYAAGAGITRLAALVFVALVGIATLIAWGPVLNAVVYAAVSVPLPPEAVVIGIRLLPLGLAVVLLVQIILTGMAYTVAAVAYGTAGQSPIEAEARGACAGVNVAINLLLTTGVIVPYLVLALPPGMNVAASVIAVVLFLSASVVPFLRNPSTGIVPAPGRTLVGWLVFMLPTAWVMELLGLFLFVVSLVVHATLGLFVPMLTISATGLRTDTGSVIVTGGIASNLNPAPTYNIGTFTFVRTITPPLVPIYNDAAFAGFEASVQNHEIGHQLNLGAFGTAFNLVGFVDEWLGPLVAGPGYAVYGEDLASTNDPSPTPLFPTPLNMWVI